MSSRKFNAIFQQQRSSILKAIACVLLVAALRKLYYVWRVRNTWHLKGKVAIVTGGSRGVGRGVCLELGRAGATVYVVGRSRRDGPCNYPGQVLKGAALSGTIDATAEEVTALGGIGIALPCDCADDAQMGAAIETVRAAHNGRLDILVNCAIMIRDDVRQKPPFWEQELAVYDAYHTVGTRSTYVMSTLATPLLLANADVDTLIVNVSSNGSQRYLFNVAYGVGKSGLDRIGKDMHVDLRRAKTRVNVVTLHPGIVQTERMQEHAAAFRRSLSIDVGQGETVRYTGRAVCALAANPTEARRYSGKVVTCTQLANSLSFTDVDGRRPADPMTLTFFATNFLPIFLKNKLNRLRGTSSSPRNNDAVREPTGFQDPQADGAASAS